VEAQFTSPLLERQTVSPPFGSQAVAKDEFEKAARREVG
jgi:hypothetical protein